MKKTTRKILIPILMLSLIFSICGCSAEQSAKNTVDNMFKAFEELDFEKAKKYIDTDEIKFTDNSNSVTGNAEMYMQTLFDRLSHEIVSAEAVDDDTVTVKTKITAVNMEPVMINFFTKAMQYTFAAALSEEKPTDDEMNQQLISYFVECATADDNEMITNEVDITVTKVDGNWTVSTDETFINALFGNLLDALSGIENAINGTSQE